MTKKLLIKVIGIEGKCPVYSVGDRIILDEGYEVNLRETTNICVHSLASIMPYYNALNNGIAPEKLGLANRQGKVCVQYQNPCQITSWTVIFGAL